MFSHLKEKPDKIEPVTFATENSMFRNQNDASMRSRTKPVDKAQRKHMKYGFGRLI